MRGWFFIVFRAFMILDGARAYYSIVGYEGWRIVTHRTIVAWITYLRSSSTVFRTSLDSALTSALIGWFRFTRIFFDLKSEDLG
jgi:hypothetical protein